MTALRVPCRPLLLLALLCTTGVAPASDFLPDATQARAAIDGLPAVRAALARAQAADARD